MFSNEELEVMQLAMFDTVINYIKTAHYEGHIKHKEAEESMALLKKADKSGITTKLLNKTVSIEPTLKPSDVFDNNEANIFIFQTMEMIHKIDDILDTGGYAFYDYIKEEDVLDMDISENISYHPSFVEYYNYFIDLFMKWEDAE